MPEVPPSAETWGWAARPARPDSAQAGVTHDGRGRKIGWVEPTELYLDPDAVFAALVELARDQGQTYPLSQRTLFRRLHAAGLLLRTEAGRAVCQVTVEGARRRVLVLAPATLLG